MKRTMSESDNDRLENFFRKAASKPEISFNEEDWKRLEARLDAQGAGVADAKRTGSKIISALVLGTILLFSSLLWVDAPYDIVSSGDENSSEHVDANIAVTDGEPETRQEAGAMSSDDIDGMNKNNPTEKISGCGKTGSSAEGKTFQPQEHAEVSRGTNRISDNEQAKRMDQNKQSEPAGIVAQSKAPDIDQWAKSQVEQSSEGHAVFTDIEGEQISRELIQIYPAVAEKIKQKAVVELPGAEEEETGKADAMVSEEHASDHKKHVAMPRLTLLLSFAPDFSSTSITEFNGPGKAFGAVIHYHVMNKWSISAGVIQNFKRYSSAGEDYEPPKGYWKYYTNGIIPRNIDGSCSILEFPVMVQYTITSSGKNRWLAGAGASSYLMLSESYKYYFEDPNPGAKEGWDSKNTSRFLFNMLNLSIGYERQVVPGLMLGLEPYVKIPLEDIGWSNIKLLSTGASITLRYKILGRQDVSVPNRSRAPD